MAKEGGLRKRARNPKAPEKVRLGSGQHAKERKRQKKQTGKVARSQVREVQGWLNLPLLDSKEDIKLSLDLNSDGEYLR